MKRLIVGLGLLATSSTVEAATYTITTTPEQDAALADVVATVNADLTKADPPKKEITVDQYVGQRVQDVLNSYLGNYREKQLQQLRATFDALPSDVRQQVQGLTAEQIQQLLKQ
jgi:phage terminase large subunit